MSEAPAPRVSPDFQLHLTAAPEDIDELGHVSNLVYLRFVQEVAKAHSRAVGWDHAAYVRLGAVFVVRRHDIEYLAPAYAGEAITVTTWIEDFSAATSTRRTRIVRDHDSRELARATTTWAMVSTDTGRPRRIAPEIKDAFATAPIASR